MVATLSKMNDLGAPAPDFSLPDVSNDYRVIDREEFLGQAMLIIFICNHCPFVVHVIKPLAALANRYQQKGVGVVAISSNDVESYPQDGPEKMLGFAKEHQFEFPYCYDQSQQVAKDFGAACTPDFFIYDASHKLRYRGQMDDSRPGNNIEVSGQDLERALDAVLSGAEIEFEQKPSIGCNIKWKQG